MTPDPKAAPRRRAARRSGRPAPTASAGLAAGLVALSVLAALAAGAREVPPAERAGLTTEAVQRASLSCPQGSDLPSRRASLLSGTVPGEALGGDGTVVRAPLTPDVVTAKGTPARRGELTVQRATGTEGSVVAAEGALAAGLFGFRVDEGRDTLAVADCAPPRATWWFTGAGASLDHTSELVISNLDAGPAVVDVRVFGPDGPVDTVGTDGISVAPGTRKSLDLTSIAPEREELGVSVEVTRGRASVAMADGYAPEPAAPAGADWVGDQEDPARAVLLAGMPAKADRHTLLVANPGALEALVDVRISGAGGSFTPTRDGQVAIPPGTVQSFDLTDAVGKEPGAVVLSADRPVVASVRSIKGGDTAYASAVRPLTGPAPAPALDGATVLLTAGARAARATVTGYTADGAPVGEQTLRVQPGVTASWQPPAKAAYLVVTPVQGPVSGAVTYAGPGVAALPLRSVPVTVARPVVRPAAG